MWLHDRILSAISPSPFWRRIPLYHIPCGASASYPGGLTGRYMTITQSIVEGRGGIKPPEGNKYRKPPTVLPNLLTCIFTDSVSLSISYMQNEIMSVICTIVLRMLQYSPSTPVNSRMRIPDAILQTKRKGNQPSDCPSHAHSLCQRMRFQVV